jgi:hypothetical protein
MDGKVVGTIWAVIHVKNRHFDAEDKRLLENLAQFAASAYRVLAEAGSLHPLLNLQRAGTHPDPPSKT